MSRNKLEQSIITTQPFFTTICLLLPIELCKIVIYLSFSIDITFIFRKFADTLLKLYVTTRCCYAPLSRSIEKQTKESCPFLSRIEA